MDAAAGWQSGAWFVAPDPGLLEERTAGHRLRAHAAFAMRCAVGVLVAGVLVSLEPLASFVGPRGSFFAIVLPPLGVRPHLGDMLNGLWRALPWIVAVVFFGTLVTSGLSQQRQPGTEIVLLFIIVFGIEWGSKFIGPLGKKLSTALFITILLTGAGGDYTAAAGLSSGMAIGYLATFVACLIPPTNATQSTRRTLCDIAKHIALLMPLMTDYLPGRQDRRLEPSLAFNESVSFLLRNITDKTKELSALSSSSQSELPHEIETAQQWIDFFDQVRTQLKGLEICLTKRRNLEFTDLPADYVRFKRIVHAAERRMASDIALYFSALAVTPDQPVSKDGVLTTFAQVKADVLAARQELIRAEVDFNSSQYLRSDFLSTYAALTQIAMICESIGQFSQPRIFSRWCLRGLLTEAFFDFWAAWTFDDHTVVRVLNGLVVSVAVVVASIFSLPVVESTFQETAGAAVAVTIIFIFQPSGFGSSLRRTKERLMGLILGSAYSYLAVAAPGAVARVALTVVFVLFAVFLLGLDALYTAQSAMFAVALALYATIGDDTFRNVSAYLVSNTLAACILIAVQSLAWLVAVQLRPKLVASIAAFARDSLSWSIVDRLHGQPGRVQVKQIQGAIENIRMLILERQGEPGFSYAVPNDIYQLVTAFERASRALLVCDMQSRDLAEHVPELVESGLLGESVMAVFRTLEALIQHELEQCALLAESMDRIAGPSRAAHSSGLILDAERRLASSLVDSLRVAGVKKSFMSSRAIVRLVSSVFSFAEYARMCSRIYPILMDVTLQYRSDRIKLKLC